MRITEQEKQWLIENSEFYTHREIIKILGRTPDFVLRWLKRLNLKTSGGQFTPNKVLIWLSENSFKYTIKELNLILFEKFNYKSDRKLSNLLNYQKFKFISKSRLYFFDETYFKIIDTKEKAWLLGMFASDGYLADDGIVWRLKDLPLIETIKNVFPTTANITKFYNKGFNYPYYQIRYNSRYLRNDLQNLGFTNNKSYDCKYPEIPEEFDFHFIRGVMDGDGSIGVYNKRLLLNFYGTQELLTIIQQKLNSETKLSKDNRKDSNYRVLSLSGSKALKQLIKIYKESENIRLERKFEIFDNYKKSL